MSVADIIDLIDYPDDVVVVIYSYAIYDNVFCGLSENIDPDLLIAKVEGLEFPEKNKIIINI